MLRPVVLLICAAASSTTAGAQRLEQGVVAMRSLSLIEASRSSIEQRPINSGTRFAVRVTLGTLGWAGGALGGGLLGVAVLGKDCGGCDEPGWGQALIGAAFGSVIATGLTVGSVGMKDGCTRRTRNIYALLGAAAGTTGGLLLSEQTSGWSIPTSAILGSAALAGGCRPRRRN